MGYTEKDLGTIARTIEDCRKKHGAGWARAAADALSISPRQVRDWAQRVGPAQTSAVSAIALPTFPDGDLPIEDVIDVMARRYERRNEARLARQWFRVDVSTDDPIGIVWFGDPHVDDDGCNWPLLRRHIEICQQDGIFGANIGDTTNNWVGRLTRLFGNQESSQATARRLAKYFLQDSGITWLLWIMGNHDAWGDGADILRMLGGQMVPSERPAMEDWQARFRLAFPSGRECRIHAAHDFKGHSMWNSLHGPQKAAHTKAEAHLYIAGHTHNWALHQEESASREFTYWLARARGYKFLDHYGESLGHFPQQEGAAILSVIDPRAKSHAGFVQCFSDVEEGAQFLAWKRGRA